MDVFLYYCLDCPANSMQMDPDSLDSLGHSKEIFGSGTTSERSTTHPKFDSTRVQTHSNSNSNVFYIQALVPLKQCSSAPYFSSPTIHRNKRLYHSNV